MFRRTRRFPVFKSVIFFAALAGSAYAALSLGQDASWDQKNYHYYGGYALLNKPPHYDFAPAQVQSFFNPLLHVPSYLMLRYLPPSATALLLGAVQGLNLWLLYLLACRLLRRLGRPQRTLLALGCAIAGFYGAANISELGTTFGDNLVSILVLSALVLFADYLSPRGSLAGRSRMKLAAAGLLLGTAVGCKLTVAIYAVPVALAWLLLMVLCGERPAGLATLGAGVLAGFIVTYGYWGLSLYREYDNPFFPYLNNVFRSRFFEPENPMDPRFLPRDWRQRVLYPFYFVKRNALVSETEFRDARMAAGYLALPVLAVWAVRRRFKPGRAPEGSPFPGEGRILLFLSVFVAGSYVLWQTLFSIYRYSVLLEMLLPLFISVAGVAMLRRVRFAAYLLLAVNVFICLYLVPLDFGRRQFGDHYLQVRPPAWEGLDRSVVVMGGDEATAYIIPSFPSSTRFVRIQANFLYPGRNRYLDEKIRSILSRYDADRTLVYLQTMEELAVLDPALSYFGIRPDPDSCHEVESDTERAGFICSTAGEPERERRIPSAPAEETPVFVDRSDVRLEVSPVDAERNQDTLRLRLAGLEARAMDLLYTLDGQEMPPVRNWSLDDGFQARVAVSGMTRPGTYHFVGVRRSIDPDRNTWIRVDVTVRVR